MAWPQSGRQEFTAHGRIIPPSMPAQCYVWGTCHSFRATSCPLPLSMDYKRSCVRAGKVCELEAQLLHYGFAAGPGNANSNVSSIDWERRKSMP